MFSGASIECFRGTPNTFPVIIAKCFPGSLRKFLSVSARHFWVMVVKAFGAPAQSSGVGLQEEPHQILDLHRASGMFFKSACGRLPSSNRFGPLERTYLQ